jgi:hypothetical protein
MSTLYVDNLQPNLESRVSIPGHVVQVVSSGEINANEAITSTSFIDTAVTVTITPTSASSKVLINFNGLCMTLGASRSRGGIRLKRTVGAVDTIVSGGSAETLGIRESSAGASTEMSSLQSYQYFDSPNTTSAVTYTIQGVMTSGTQFILYGTASSSPKNIVVQEIAQ